MTDEKVRPRSSEEQGTTASGEIRLSEGARGLDTIITAQPETVRPPVASADSTATGGQATPADFDD